MKPLRIFVSRRIPDAGMRLLQESGHDISVGSQQDDKGLARGDLCRAVAEADVLVSLLTERIDRELLSLNPGLLGVANMAVGFDNVDVGAATELGVPIGNTPGVLTDTTADLAWALILASARRIPQAHNYTVAGRFEIWRPNLLLGSDVGPGCDAQRKVLGILGYGRIGEAVAKRAQGFDMDVLGYDPNVRAKIEDSPFAGWATFDELLARSDYVSLHVPLTDETRHLIGRDQLRAMKPTAHLINTSRGPTVDEAALVEALREGWIAGAGLDVYENEPELSAGLVDLENAVLLPHVGSGTQDTRGRMATMTVANALAFVQGSRAPDTVDPEVYETAAYQKRLGSSGIGSS